MTRDRFKLRSLLKIVDDLDVMEEMKVSAIHLESQAIACRQGSYSLSVNNKINIDEQVIPFTGSISLASKTLLA